MGLLDSLWSSSGSSSGDGGLFSSLLPVAVTAGLNAYGLIEGQKQQDKKDNKMLAFEEKKLAQERELALAALQARAAEGGSSAAAAKAKILQEAYRTLVEAHLRGGELGVGALNNLTQAAQAPLLRR